MKRVLPFSRRAFLQSTVAGAAVLRGRFPVFAQSTSEYSARTIELMQEATVVDLLQQFRFEDYTEKPVKIELWMKKPWTFTEADAAVYRASGVDAIALGDGISETVAEDVHARVLQVFAEWNGFLAANPDAFVRIDHVAKFELAKRTGRMGIIISWQTNHFRGPSDVDLFFGLGQRIAQLTYNFGNRIGSGFLEQRDGGLTVLGLTIMKRMEEVGMGVDVSHCGDQTTLDALDAATRPVLFTHCTCRTLVSGNLRAKSDEAIRKMARTGGVMGIAFLRFLIRDNEPVGIEHALDHFDHVRTLVGVEYLAVGSDMDVLGNGLPVGLALAATTQPNLATQPNIERYGYHVDRDGHLGVDGLDHPKRMFDLTEGLITRGYSDADIKLILGGNAVRVLGNIWSAADQPA